jgi:microcystin-dependent protein
MNRVLLPCVSFALLAAAQPAAAGSVGQHLAERMIFAGNYCPRGWMPLEGQELPISQNQALFSLLGGFTYGGNGTTTFRLPAAKPLFEADANGNQVPVAVCIATTGIFPSF